MSSIATPSTAVRESILDAIGNTPLVSLSRMGAGLKAQLLAKVEYMNPGGSIKDRAAVSLIEAAERDGHLKPGGTIVEPTSGNTGTGLAIAARLKGYRMIAVMPDKVAREKIDLLRAYGAEVVMTPAKAQRGSGESYYDYVREHIFAPAGMTSTDSQPESEVPNRSIGYTRLPAPGCGGPTPRRCSGGATPPATPTRRSATWSDSPGRSRATGCSAPAPRR